MIILSYNSYGDLKLVFDTKTYLYENVDSYQYTQIKQNLKHKKIGSAWAILKNNSYTILDEIVSEEVYNQRGD